MARGEKKALQSDGKAIGDELTFAAIELRFSFLQRFPTSPPSQAHAVTSPVSRLAWFIRQFGCRALRCTLPPPHTHTFLPAFESKLVCFAVKAFPLISLPPPPLLLRAGGSCLAGDRISHLSFAARNFGAGGAAASTRLILGKLRVFEEFWLLVDLQILRDLYRAVELPLRKPECFFISTSIE
ncbi:unnamed protein product [Natator depressus]